MQKYVLVNSVTGGEIDDTQANGVVEAQAIFAERRPDLNGATVVEEAEHYAESNLDVEDDWL